MRRSLLSFLAVGHRIGLKENVASRGLVLALYARVDICVHE